MTLLDFIVLALAAISIADLIADDVWSGPFNILHKFRHMIGIRYNEESELESSNIIAHALLCPVCGPFWLSAVIVALINLLPFSVYILTPFAVSGLVLLVKYR